jgi:hypothetical protein
MGEEKFFFEWKFNCSGRSEPLSTAGAQRIKTIIKCSIQYGDEKFFELETKVQDDQDFTIQCHRSCVSTYTSKTHLKRAILSTGSGDSEASSSHPKKQRRSNTAFEFQKHCVFCGENCYLKKDPKHPDRWRAAYQFRQLETKKKLVKDSVIETCDARNDTWASEVRLRLSGVVSDLHAADAMYHVDCRNKFMSTKNVEDAKRKVEEKEAVDIPFHETVRAFSADKERMWNSVEVHKLYTDSGGCLLSRSNLIKALQEQFCSLVVLSAPGYAHIITFPNKAASILRLCPDDGDDELNAAISKVAKQIKREISGLKKNNKEKYNLHVSHDNVVEETSMTLMRLCGALSTKLDKTPPALLIGSIVSATLSNTATNLQSVKEV